MSWKKYFRVIKTQTPFNMAQPVDRFGGTGTGTGANFASFLPLVYAGPPNRIQRYYQFDDMDRDSDINAALDTIADFSTQSEEQADEPFEISYNGEPNESETKILKTMLSKWVRLNKFKSRLWNIFRDALKNGDAFFLRDPETQEWLWLDHFMVEMVKVDDTLGKKPEEYLVRGLDYNRQTKFATKQADPNQYRTPYGTSTVGSSRVSSVSGQSGPAAFSLSGTASDPRQRHMLGPYSQEVSVIDAEYVIHLSLSVGNDINWPFGVSILEPIFKTFKQKELLEDAIIIYRVQRAPERRIFYIDVGTMPPERAKRHIEMIKNDIHQRRIPNRTGTGGSMLDAAYNPLSINDDYFLAQSSDGRGSKVETLPGGEQTGEITDLMFFSRKLARGLRVPVSYLNLGEDDTAGGVTFNDGKLGAAMIQEFRFTKYCQRWQLLLAPVFDKEFKRYLVKNGIEMDWGLFELNFTPPQSFTRYRQIELDAQRVQVYQGVAENKYLANQFKLTRFLGLTEDEMRENEEQWAKENADKIKKKTGSTPAETSMGDTGLSAVGVRPMDSDMPMDMPPDEMAPEGDMGPAVGGAAPPMDMGGGAAAAPGGAPPAQ
jgi:hypothetical protein